MIVHQIFAQIFEKEVKNVIVCDNYELANWLARATYGEKAFAIDCLQCPCGIGDTYHDGGFWRISEETGEKIMIKYMLSQEEQVQQLSMDNKDLIIVMADIIGGTES